MNRRELLTMIAAFTGAAMVGGKQVLAYDATTVGTNIFTPEDAAFLDEVAEVIIPRTDTPGAKDAQVGAFMTVYVSDCFTKPEQDDFRAGIEALKSEAQAKYGKPFTDLKPEERQEFLQAANLVAADQAKVVKEALEKQKQDIAQQTNDAMAADEALAAVAKDLPKLHWFTPIQQLTLFGFFTSQPGATQVLRYEAVPGEYIGDLEYKGEPAWAT